MDNFLMTELILILKKYLNLFNQLYFQMKVKVLIGFNTEANKHKILKKATKVFCLKLLESTLNLKPQSFYIVMSKT